MTEAEAIGQTGQRPISIMTEADPGKAYFLTQTV